MQIDTTSIELHYAFNETMRWLVDGYFLPSLPLSFEPHPHLLDMWSSGGFNRDSFHTILGLKTRRIIDAIQSGEDGTLLVFSDVDLVFLDDPVDDLIRRMEEKDLLFQAEWANDPREVNTGFQVVRRSRKSLDFYKSVLWHQDRYNPPSEQHWANQLLRKANAPAWGLLPYTYSSGSNGGLHKDSVLYHANNTFSDSLNQKKRALDLALEQQPFTWKKLSSASPLHPELHREDRSGNC